MNRKTSTLISLGISVALIAAGILFLYSHHNYMGYGAKWIRPHHMMMTGGGMGLIMVLFWVVLLTAVVLLISGMITRRHFEGHSVGNPEAESDALNILKQRYANGELTKMEFEQMKRDLQ